MVVCAMPYTLKLTWCGTRVNGLNSHSHAGWAIRARLCLIVANFHFGHHCKASVGFNFPVQEWGAAVQCCDTALQVTAAEATAARAWLRRAKANLGRFEFEVRTHWQPVEASMTGSVTCTVAQCMCPLNALTAQHYSHVKYGHLHLLNV